MGALIFFFFFPAVTSACQITSQQDKKCPRGFAIPHWQPFFLVAITLANKVPVRAFRLRLSYSIYNYGLTAGGGLDFLATAYFAPFCTRRAWPHMARSCMWPCPTTFFFLRLGHFPCPPKEVFLKKKKKKNWQKREESAKEGLFVERRNLEQPAPQLTTYSLFFAHVVKSIEGRVLFYAPLRWIVD
ncbi:hypothetical protein V8C35DRAFT_70193 [Trichoderma chlorosporum]